MGGKKGGVEEGREERREGGREATDQGHSCLLLIFRRFSPVCSRASISTPGFPSRHRPIQKLFKKGNTHFAEILFLHCPKYIRVGIGKNTASSHQRLVCLYISCALLYQLSGSLVWQMTNAFGYISASSPANCIAGVSVRAT